MRAGLLRDIVQFQKEHREPNDIGGSTVTWKDTIQLRGNLRQMNGREVMQAGRLEASNMAILTVRNDKDLASQIETGWRAVIRNENWQIENRLRGPGRGDRLELVVQRGTAQ
jgi:SPP1 family predicted phage head-tail adaptor